MIRTRFEHDIPVLPRVAPQREAARTPGNRLMKQADIPVVQYFAKSYRHGRKAVFFVCAAKVRNPEKLSKPIWNASTPIFRTNMKKAARPCRGQLSVFWMQRHGMYGCDGHRNRRPETTPISPQPTKRRQAAENGPQPPSYSGIAICCTGCSRFRSSGWD